MTKKDTSELEDLFQDDNVPESNFFKFEKVGDRVGGILVEVQDKAGKDPFPAQRVFTLKQKDGALINVGIALHKDYIIGRANTAKLGDMLGFEFVKEIPPSNKGFHPAKSIEVYVKHIVKEEEEKFGGE